MPHGTVRCVVATNVLLPRNLAPKSGSLESSFFLSCQQSLADNRELISGALFGIPQSFCASVFFAASLHTKALYMLFRYVLLHKSHYSDH